MLKVADVCCGAIPGVDRDALFRTALNRAYYAVLMLLKLRIDAVQGPGTPFGERTKRSGRQFVPRDQHSGSSPRHWTNFEMRESGPTTTF